MSKKQKINPIDILDRLDWTESEELELKAAKGGFPKSLWESYSALANTHGGVILLGIEDDGTVCGLDDIPKLKKSFWDTVNNRGKVSSNLLTDADVSEVEVENGTLLAIRVPQAPRYQRPVYLGQNPLTGTYRRNYEGDYHCTEQEVGRMLSDRAEDPADSRILEGFSLEDLDQASLQQYRQRFVSHKPTHPWLGEDDVGLLTKLGGWRKDRKTGREGLTVAGVLMFGTDEAIREAIPAYHVDYREKLSDDPTVRYTDRLFVDGTWVANLFQFYLRVMQRLSGDIKLPFQLDDNLFRKGETVVHEAIREVLVNALIHGDYQGQGGIVVEKYKDRFEFSNPGLLLISFEQLFKGNVSECRNKSLQKMFAMFGAAEKAGSGVDKIRRGWDSQHWRSPGVREQVQPDRVLWMLPMVSLIPEESLQRLKALFGKRYDQFSKQEVQALVTADLEGMVDNSRMRQITQMHASDITRLLQGLVGQGVLVQAGHGRWTRYRLVCAPSSVHKDSSSVHKDLSSAHSRATSLASFSDDEMRTLYKIATPALSQSRLPPKEMEALLLDICRGRWLTRRQMGDVLQRNPDGLRSRFLTAMVRHGLLQLKYPHTPNRADQAYTTRQERNEP